MRKAFLSFSLILMTVFGTLSFVDAPTAEAGWVNGYHRSDGTYVQGHYRSRPNAYKFDNYSYDGGERYNDSYYFPTRNYSSEWYTPSYYDWDY